MGHILTVIIRDDSPLVHMGEPVRNRTVRINLTAEQSAALELRQTHTLGGITFYEEISTCILEQQP